MINETLNKMKQLKLQGMHNALQTAIETRADYTKDELLAYLIEAELLDRQSRKTQRLLKAARFRYEASVEQFNFSANRNLDRDQITRLCDCSFIERAENLILTGSTGVGKSYIASALGKQACIRGYKVLYYNTGKLFRILKMAKADNTYQRILNKLAKTDLLILDDFGLHPIDSKNRLALLDIFEDRHGKKSTIIASQLPLSTWYEIIEEQTVADAILDRLAHSAHRIDLKGESLRKIKL